MINKSNNNNEEIKMTLEEQLRKRLDTDKLITRYINDVKEDVEFEYPTDATAILDELEGQLHDIAWEYMTECVLSSRTNRRTPKKEDLLRSFDDVYRDVCSVYFE
jgi:hypothetical protein